MPEKRTSDRRRRTDEEDAAQAGDERPDDEPADDERIDNDRTGGQRVSAVDAARAGVRGIADLVGKKPEGITSVEPTDDGWRVGVEVLEDERVPSTSDILAIYEADLDYDGSLLSYRRTRRYPRGRGDSGTDSDGGR